MYQMFIPPLESNNESVWRWFLNIAVECETAPSELVRRALTAYYTEAGLLGPCNAYFRRHFSDSVAIAARHLKCCHQGRPILDLGCGLGTQSILFALLGIPTIALDMDRTALNVLSARIRFYEELLGRKLDINVVRANAIDLPGLQLGILGGVHAMFSFNMIPKPQQLFLTIGRITADAGAFALLDGNCAFWLRRLGWLRRPNALSPLQLRDACRKAGFVIDGIRGAIAVPELIWRSPFHGGVSLVDKVLTHRLCTSASYQLLAHKCE